MLRREFLYSAAAVATLGSRAVCGAAPLNHKERVDRALKGSDVDRPPFTFWHHFGLKSAEAHAERTLAFHKQYRTDIVKVMSDFPYPKPQGKWYELKSLENPFPDQIRALELIRNGLNGDAYFIETIFNPFNVAEKLSSKEEVRKLMQENPKALLAALDVITQSEVNHAKRAIALGARGILLAVANANSKELSTADYTRFNALFDKRILEAVSGAPLNFLHLHVEREYLDQFRSFPAAVLNYSQHVTGIPIAEVRAKFPQQVIAGGIDEVNYEKLTAKEIRAQWEAASQAAGKKYILTPGCSVPNDSSTAELELLPKTLGA
jgi:uroporphyrinogen-III decarboxylase